MDQESIVYGCIKDSTLLSAGEKFQHRVANRRAMLALPAIDDWPFLSREMFAIPGAQSTQNDYQTDVIHFGASYKAVEYEWAQWIKKFEELLESMYWVSAIVHLETELSGTHTFMWESKNRGHQPGDGIINVRCEWNYELDILTRRA